MINLTIKDAYEGSSQEMEVTLFSNGWEVEISIGDNFHESMNLDKDQVQQLIDFLTTVHEEMH